MNREKEKIMTQINNFREELDFFKNVGLKQPVVPQINYPDELKESAAKMNVLRSK